MGRLSAQTGATAVEYAIMAAAVAAAVIAVVFGIGQATEQGLNGTCTKIDGKGTMECNL